MSHHVPPAGPRPPLPPRPSEPSARFARGVSDVLSPPLMSAALVAVAAAAAARGGETGAWRWALVQIALGVVVPMAHLTWLVRRGHVADIHLPFRHERVRPFILTGGGTALALALAMLLGAPGLMNRVFTGILVQTLLLFAITLRWQISIHSATAAAFATAVARLGAVPAAVAAVAIAGVVGWARVRLLRHTPAQVIAGFVLGAAAMWLVLAGA